VIFDLSAALIFASMVVREGQFKNLAQGYGPFNTAKKQLRRAQQRAEEVFADAEPPDADFTGAPDELAVKRHIGG
jgi:hypothetical protein